MPTFTQIMADVAAKAAEFGTTADVAMRDGTTFSIKVFEGRGQARGLTDGVDQERYRVRVLASAWDAAAPRPPEKGDILTIHSRRHAVDTMHRRGVGDAIQMYVLYMQG